MKKVNLKNKAFSFGLYATLIAASLASCSKDDDDDDNDSQASYTMTEVQRNGETYTQIEGFIDEDVTLDNTEKYILKGGVFVNSGNTLTITEGVEIYGDKTDGPDFLTISQGADINAQGTAQNPIVMSSFTKEKGSWGGLIINGYGNINNGTTAEGECGSGTYGGDDDADNSGILRYIRIEYAGFICATDDELNGLTFNAVGSGTTVEYIQTYKGADDGFEWFGGAVNCKYLVSTGNRDDSFDWTQGWRGKGQFFVVHQDEVNGDRGFECDNNGDDNAATPYSNPTIANATVIGATDAEDTDNQGMKLREGTKAAFYNVIVTNFPKRGVQVEHDVTLDNLNNGELIFKNSIVDNANPFVYTDSDGNEATPAIDFAADATNSTSLGITLNGVVGVVTTGAVDPSTIDPWFTSVNFIGAVDASNNWTAGWTKSL